MSITFRTEIVLADVDAHGLTLSGSLEAVDLPQISALVEVAKADAVGATDGPESQVRVAADLKLAPARKPKHWQVSGDIRASIPLVCQRCLELTAVDVSRPVDLALVGSDVEDETVAAVSPDSERWDHDSEILVLADLIDEWILLELPMVVAHERVEQCGELARRLDRPATQTDTQTPFADLAGLMAGKTQ
ncbi:MAG: DUF177 domain-containing protein [Pseudomonadota bacterium]